MTGPSFGPGPGDARATRKARARVARDARKVARATLTRTLARVTFEHLGPGTRARLARVTFEAYQRAKVRARATRPPG